jgi:NAD(P)-dependent dehydrogenase (short-subunit alcohol dehydrogenase family)
LRFLGASSGIGAGTAILFCKLGAEVAITGRNVDNLAKTAAECEKGNGKKVRSYRPFHVMIEHIWNKPGWMKWNKRYHIILYILF